MQPFAVAFVGLRLRSGTAAVQLPWMSPYSGLPVSTACWRSRRKSMPWRPNFGRVIRKVTHQSSWGRQMFRGANWLAQGAGMPSRRRIRPSCSRWNMRTYCPSSSSPGTRVPHRSQSANPCDDVAGEVGEFQAGRRLGRMHPTRPSASHLPTITIENLLFEAAGVPFGTPRRL